jgi:CubicO group peptidase (beta-lactamase class C family)
VPTPTTPYSIQEIDAYLDSLVEWDAFSGVVLVARQGLVLINQGYGPADQEQGIPNTPQTKFRIGSITKQFTAMGILILQAQGKLDVQDPICRYVPECPVPWEGITLHHLLVHTSGIPDFVDLPGYEESKGTPTAPIELIARFKDEPLAFPPGSEWRYSNSGYILLGYVIEQASGQTYADFIQTNIFAPLGMASSGYDHNQDVLALGYSGYGEDWLEADYIDASVPYAAGALYSTVGDLLLWDQALYTEKLVSQELLDTMFTPFASNPLGGYGYGWFISERHNRLVVRHGGGGDGYVGIIERYPEDGVTIILLSNRETTDIGTIATEVGTKVFGE